MFSDSTVEREAIESISLAEPTALLDRFATLVRESGTKAERAAAEYIVERLQALGVPVRVYEPQLYLSIPERSELQLTSSSGTETFRSRPPAFARPTNGDALTGELCYVPSQYAGGTGSLFDTPAAAQAVSGHDPVAGRVVVTEGFSMPGTVAAFERRGAVGQVFIHPGDDIHEGICTTIWGAPTVEALERKPRTPIVCVNRADGTRLIELASNGRVQASLRTWLREGWAPCLLPAVEIRGTRDPEEFLLVHGHYDSWYEGIGDNATGDATLLELARVLHERRGDLKRSVRIAWWPGHSTGRYAGSTWYADELAQELNEWCIAQLNIDSPGCAGATAFEEVMWMAEARDLCVQSISDSVGATAQGMRPLRAGDYSFNQIGLSGFYMLLSNIPADERRARGFYAVGGCGGNTAWHTPRDLMDVADPAIIGQDLKVYLTTIVRVLNAPLHPFDYTRTVDELIGVVKGYHEAAAGLVDLTPLVTDLQSLGASIRTWRQTADAFVTAHPADDEARRAFNATLRHIARVLVPINYSRGERFDHDPAIKFPAVPRLEAANRIASAPGDHQSFLRTGLVREQNKLRALVRELCRELRNTQT